MSRRGTTTIRLATRGSDLALRQASEVEEELAGRRRTVELVEVETTGDRIQDSLIAELGKTGAFVRSLDEQVLDGSVEAAVHSMKDMPTDAPEALIVAAIPERSFPEDVVVTPDGTPLADLPPGAVVGTSSLRRQAQILHHRPDLTVEPIRGNVDTRVEKLLAPRLQREHQARMDDNIDGTDEFERTTEEWFDDLGELERQALERHADTEYDAVVLARAGLERLGLAHHVEFESLPTSRFVPAPGQGAIAVTSRDGEVAQSIHDALDHPRTRVEVTVERTILAELGGGCIAPIGVHAVVQGEHVHVDVQVFSRDGSEKIELSRDVPVERYLAKTREVARELEERGATALIQAARREVEGPTDEKVGADEATDDAEPETDEESGAEE